MRTDHQAVLFLQNLPSYFLELSQTFFSMAVCSKELEIAALCRAAMSRFTQVSYCILHCSHHVFL